MAESRKQETRKQEFKKKVKTGRFSSGIFFGLNSFAGTKEKKLLIKLISIVKTYYETQYLYTFIPLYLYTLYLYSFILVF